MREKSPVWIIRNVPVQSGTVMWEKRAPLVRFNMALQAASRKTDERLYDWLTNRIVRIHSDIWNTHCNNIVYYDIFSNHFTYLIRFFYFSYSLEDIVSIMLQVTQLSIRVWCVELCTLAHKVLLNWGDSYYQYTFSRQGNFELIWR